MGERRRVGPYLLGQAIGRGGFSTVYRARRRGVDLAVKVFDPMLPDGQVRASFERECEALSLLDGVAGVVPQLDRGVAADGRPYLVMPYLPGGSLADLVRRRGPLPVSTSVALGITIAEALAEAHAAGILHRDLKASNVLFDADGDPALADFGLSDVGADSEVTLSGAWVTPAYVAPELVEGDAATVSSDLYSFGATLHLMLTGRLPYGVEGTIFERISAVRHGVAPVIDRADAPSELADLVASLLSRDPDDRPESAADVAGSLRDVRDTYGLVARPLDLPAAGVAGPGRRRRAVAVGAAVVVAAVAAGLTGSLQASGGPARPAVSEAAPATSTTLLTPTGPGLQLGYDYLDDRADLSPQVQSALASLDGSTLTAGSDGGPYHLPGLGQVPARFDYFFVGGSPNNDVCQARLGTGYVTVGLDSRIWTDGPVQAITWVFDDERGAASYFAGMSLEFGVGPDECEGYDDQEPGPEAFDGVTMTHRESDLAQPAGYDELNDWVKDSATFPGLQEHKVLARRGRAVVVVTAWYPPGDDRVDPLGEALGRLGVSLDAAGLTGG